MEVSAEKVYLLSRPDNRVMDGEVLEVQRLDLQGAEFMNIYRRIAKGAVFGLMLAVVGTGIQGQENKPPETKKAERPPAQREQREQREHTAAPREQRTAPAPQNAPPQQHRREGAPAEAQHPAVSGRPAQAPEQQPHPRQQTPVETQRTAPVQRESQPGGGAQPRRNTGDQPTAQPGRTFGTNPRQRDAEPARGPSQMGARPVAPASRIVTTRGGDVIHRDANGQVRQVRMNNGTVVYHPPNAPRRVEVVRPGGRLVVASAPGRGYVQRPVVIHNTTIIKRTYVYNGVPQARIFRPRVYNGVSLVVYTPVRYYRPAFYVYAFNPWPRPIVYGWGWRSSPWFGYYGGYFTPYPVYASPSLWLTDYLIAATLEAAYEDRMAARSMQNNYVDGGQVAPMSPEVKQAIADEVRRQIDRERAEGQNANAPGGQDTNLFGDNGPHVFVVHAAYQVNSNAGECTIGEGDVLEMNGPPQANSTWASLTVLSSRGQGCRKGSSVSVALQDLQEMQNQMQATIDRGLGDLQTKQGQGGLPMPPQGSVGTIDSPYAQEAQPDSNVASELTSVSQEADRAEQQVVSQAGDTPPTLSLGMTVADVKAIQGEPQKIVDLGSKKIYVYKDLKITFSDGKVSDIQ